MLNVAGYQETFPTAYKQPVQKQPSNCFACAEVIPYGCEECRRSINNEAPRKLYVGSGEDMPQWSEGALV